MCVTFSARSFGTASSVAFNRLALLVGFLLIQSSVIWLAFSWDGKVRQLRGMLNASEALLPVPEHATLSTVQRIWDLGLGAMATATHLR